jgi:hypothetical protein
MEVDRGCAPVVSPNAAEGTCMPSSCQKPNRLNKGQAIQACIELNEEARRVLERQLERVPTEDTQRLQAAIMSADERIGMLVQQMDKLAGGSFNSKPPAAPTSAKLLFPVDDDDDDDDDGEEEDDELFPYKLPSPSAKPKPKQHPPQPLFADDESDNELFTSTEPTSAPAAEVSAFSVDGDVEEKVDALVSHKPAPTPTSVAMLFADYDESDELEDDELFSLQHSSTSAKPKSRPQKASAGHVSHTL